MSCQKFVITAIGRTPIGRAVKGSLIDQRPDDLGAYVVDEVLKQIPQLDRRQIDDVICGCALPGGEQGHNVARIISLRPVSPGTTVNRYCASSLQAVRWRSTPSRPGRLGCPAWSSPARRRRGRRTSRNLTLSAAGPRRLAWRDGRELPTVRLTRDETTVPPDTSARSWPPGRRAG